MEKEVRLGFIGFGVVGSGVIKLILKNSELIEKRLGLKLRIVKVADLDITTEREGVKIDPSLLTTDPNAILKNPEIDIVIELIGGIEPAKSYIISAMQNKKSVVTANKALLAEYGDELFTIAEHTNTTLLFEAAVGGGIPVIQGIRDGLSGCYIRAIFGIMNGTCNYILSKMSTERRPLLDVLNEAKKKGYAEADPSLDINGIDTAHKLGILSSLAFGQRIRPQDIYTEGITKITDQDMLYAKEEFGYVVKLLGIAKETDGELEVRVHPTMIPEGHLLSSVQGAFNAIYVISDTTGPIIFYGQGAGQLPAASAVLSDIIAIAKRPNYGRGWFQNPFRSAPFVRRLKSMDEIASKYYIKFKAIDKPGVLSLIAGILGNHNISIASVIQKERYSKEAVPIIMLTHEAKEKNIKHALEQIDRLPVIKGESLFVRVEEFNE